MPFLSALTYCQGEEHKRDPSDERPEGDDERFHGYPLPGRGLPQTEGRSL